MKKVFFSAIALVAFSFAGMANEIEEKKTEVKTTESMDCQDQADYEYELALLFGMTENQAILHSNVWYAICSEYTSINPSIIKYIG